MLCRLWVSLGIKAICLEIEAFEAHRQLLIRSGQEAMDGMAEDPMRGISYIPYAATQVWPVVRTTEDSFTYQPFKLPEPETAWELDDPHEEG